jgi:TPR repeat protein
MSRTTTSHRRQRSREDFQQSLAWYMIRDLFFGQHYVEQNLKKALGLAAVCGHPNAVWLTKLFAGRDVGSPEEARHVFLGCEGDPRAVCFAALLAGSNDGIRRAADLGDALAQARIAMRGEERFRWAQKSSAQGERDGFVCLGCCYRDGEGCERNRESAKENFLIAAELGYVDAIIEFGLLLNESDPQRFVWLGKGAVSGYAWPFLNEMVEQLRNFTSGSGRAKIVAIGRVLNGHIDNEKQTIFNYSDKFDTFVGPANQALQFYHFQLQSYRKAVDAWTLVGIRYFVVKDIRKMIAQMIWDSREEAKYVEVK